MTAPAPRTAGQPTFRFGQVWESRREVIGTMRYLIVFSDADNTAFADRRMIAVEVDSAAVYEGAFREPIIDAGTAHLDRLTWITTRRLGVQLGAELHPDRHTEVTQVLRELIGNS